MNEMPSATATSASLPVLIHTPTWMPRRAARASRWVPKAPDWVTMPSGPGGVGPSSRNELKVAAWPVRMLNRPRQFGPHRDDRALDPARHRGEVGIGREALHRVAGRVDRVEAAPIAGLAVIAQR